MFGLNYANKPADKNHPYGHGRAEPLITFLVVGFLTTSATIIAYESIKNIGTPHELPKVWTLLILAPLIVWKEIIAGSPAVSHDVSPKAPPTFTHNLNSEE